MRTRRLAVTRRLAAALGGLALSVAVLACSPAAPAAGSPRGVVETALQAVAAKDLEALRGVACAGQEDLIREQLGMAGLGSTAELVPGLDTQALLDAIVLDVADVEIGEAAESGDIATVPVTGSVKVTFDKAAMRPILASILEQQGTSMSDEQLDALLDSLAAYGQDVPVEQSIRLVREGGAWKVCQETIEAPSP